MPELRYRSRTYKRTFRRTPGGKTVLHYKKKKPAKHQCAECGQLLHGVPRGRPYQIRKLAKSKRRPTGHTAEISALNAPAESSNMRQGSE